MKNTKRSMLITTVLMVVVLVVAISTSTFAWYTAQSTVVATNTTVTSATSSSASLALDTTNSGATATASSVTLTMNKTVEPMIPGANPTTDTTWAAFATSGFETAPIDNAGNFTQDGAATSPAIIKTVALGDGAASELNGFYVINTNGTNATNVNVTVTIDTDGYTLLTSKPNNWVTGFANYYTRTETGLESDPYEYTALTATTNWAEGTYYVKNSVIAADLRVAVFADDKYVGTWASTAANTYYGEISNGAAGTLATKYTATASGTALSLGSFTALQGKLIQVAAWFDGVGLVVDDSGMPAVFNISFNAA